MNVQRWVSSYNAYLVSTVTVGQGRSVFVANRFLIYNFLIVPI